MAVAARLGLLKSRGQIGRDRLEHRAERLARRGCEILVREAQILTGVEPAKQLASEIGDPPPRLGAKAPGDRPRQSLLDRRRLLFPARLDERQAYRRPGYGSRVPH